MKHPLAEWAEVPDELPDHITDDLLASFQHVNVRAALQTLSYSVAEYLPRLPLSGIAISGTLLSGCTVKGLTREGVLQLAILLSPPFQNTEEHQVRDVRPNVPILKRLRSCQDRIQLVEVLSSELLHIESLSQGDGKRGEKEQEKIDKALKVIMTPVEIFLRLHHHGIAPIDQRLHYLGRKAVLNAFRIVEMVARGVTEQDEMKIKIGGEPIFMPYPLVTAAYKRSSLLMMKEAFHEYGPRKWPNDAIFHAMAAILKFLGVEDGTHIPTIADRLRKRLTRPPTRWDKIVEALRGKIPSPTRPSSLRLSSKIFGTDR